MLYTGKGDKGDTGFFGSGKRISKASARPEALGACDELNSLLGVCKIAAQKKDVEITKANKTVSSVLADVQNNLFIVQGELAGAGTKVTAKKVTEAEDLIAHIEKELPPIRTFRVAGGTELSALLDYARAVSRRTERRAIAAVEAEEVRLGDQSKKYLNRLSTLLYALARLANVKSGKLEESPTYD